MIQNRVIGRTLAWVLSFALILSMTFVSSAESNIWDIDAGSLDAEDMQMGDGTDITDLTEADSQGTHSGDESVSGNDIQTEEIMFRVTDSHGVEFGAYKDWNGIYSDSG